MWRGIKYGILEPETRRRKVNAKCFQAAFRRTDRIREAEGANTLKSDLVAVSEET